MTAGRYRKRPIEDDSAEAWRERALAAEAQLATQGIPRGQQAYDRDPDVLAWARAHVQRYVDMYRADAPLIYPMGASPRKCGKQVADAMERCLTGGGKTRDGAPIIAAFDARKPRLSAELAAREAAL